MQPNLPRRQQKDHVYNLLLPCSHVLAKNILQHLANRVKAVRKTRILTQTQFDHHTILAKVLVSQR
ncbi:hypothetical protein HanRHA438_Chr12g0572841 [Helianthus annuus]|nr:hypothetical protein HanHA300_Chr12g0460581 [Helianthus annuus]KAJ0506777.1 hypothetical protein HanHA89_Chr12g0485981 [Helianthus annuus]KAJ0676454.1 hypothetical protein HanLR1_Chr12g0462991 [Helianthus annuus]KAJ0679665.1 hypothetical protein HanOQP8_Chr12g0462211 [Helianthus annuus]KAJ0868279.1 hypothetical protein HanRHA438_Chr12g0572841 [Helianthus annuus]